VEANHEGKVIYLLELELCRPGADRRGPAGDVEPILMIEGPRLLFPMPVDRHLDDARWRFAPLLINPIDFAAMYGTSSQKPRGVTGPPRRPKSDPALVIASGRPDRGLFSLATRATCAGQLGLGRRMGARRAWGFPPPSVLLWRAPPSSAPSPACDRPSVR